MSRHVGRGLRWTAVGHTLVGLWLFADPLLAILQDGMLGAVAARPERKLAFWFLLYSPVLWVLGDLFDHALDHWDRPLALRLSVLLLGMGAVGVALLPLSGFWLVLGLGAMGFASGPLRRAAA